MKRTVEIQRPSEVVEVHSHGLSRKRDALLRLGLYLRSYAELQANYTALIHAPDSQIFSKKWDATLYAPIRRICEDLLATQKAAEPLSLLYCAPGTDAPLLLPTDESHIADRFANISLADIDNRSLMNARERLEKAVPQVSVRAAQTDFTGGLGQRLCDVLADALDQAVTVHDVHAMLLSTGSIVEGIFEPHNTATAQAKIRADFEKGGILGRHTMTVTEMVASFTGTAVWMAFRSALYTRFSDTALDEIERCLAAAGNIVQLYNSRFLTFHLDTLAEFTAKGGYIVMVFDTLKRYDDPAIPAQASFPDGQTPHNILCQASSQIVSQHSLVWRDHPESFKVDIHQISIQDFQAHAHDVNVFVLAAHGVACKRSLYPHGANL